MRNAQALIGIALDAKGSDAHKHMPRGLSSPDIAMGLAGLVLQRQRLVMEFTDIHHPTLRWLSPKVMTIDTQEEGWADDLTKRLSREQVAALLHAATRKLT